MMPPKTTHDFLHRHQRNQPQRGTFLPWILLLAAIAACLAYRFASAG